MSIIKEINNNSFKIHDKNSVQLINRLKPGFHMIATIAMIAVIAAIAEKKKVQRSQQSYGNHFPAIVAIPSAKISPVSGFPFKKWVPFINMHKCRVNDVTYCDNLGKK